MTSHEHLVFPTSLCTFNFICKVGRVRLLLSGSLSLECTRAGGYYIGELMNIFRSFYM